VIKQATRRGYVTYEQLNAVMPSKEVRSEQIEDILAMLNEMGISVVETEEAETGAEAEAEAEAEEVREKPVSATRRTVGSRELAGSW
jgi:RNA polymerase primary sigma factor